jgi:hypothetical protein
VAVAGSTTPTHPVAGVADVRTRRTTSSMVAPPLLAGSPYRPGVTTRIAGELHSAAVDGDDTEPVIARVVVDEFYTARAIRNGPGRAARPARPSRFPGVRDGATISVSM